MLLSKTSYLVHDLRQVPYFHIFLSFCFVFVFYMYHSVCPTKMFHSTNIYCISRVDKWAAELALEPQV